MKCHFRFIHSLLGRWNISIQGKTYFESLRNGQDCPTCRTSAGKYRRVFRAKIVVTHSSFICVLYVILLMKLLHFREGLEVKDKWRFLTRCSKSVMQLWATLLGCRLNPLQAGTHSQTHSLHWQVQETEGHSRFVDNKQKITSYFGSGKKRLGTLNTSEPQTKCKVTLENMLHNEVVAQRRMLSRCSDSPKYLGESHLKCFKEKHFCALKSYK